MNRDTGELVTLATGLAMGEGQDITLPPGTVMAVKVSIITPFLSFMPLQYCIIQLYTCNIVCMDVHGYNRGCSQTR